jgi:hypothetical protein
MCNARFLWCCHEVYSVLQQLSLSRQLCSSAVLCTSRCVYGAGVLYTLINGFGVLMLYPALLCVHYSAVEFAKECDASVLADITEDEVKLTNSCSCAYKYCHIMRSTRHNRSTHSIAQSLRSLRCVKCVSHVVSKWHQY